MMIIIPIIILFIVIWIISSIKTDDSLNDGHKEKPIHKDEDGEKHIYKSPIYDESEDEKKERKEDDEKIEKLKHKDEDEPEEKYKKEKSEDE